MTVHQILLDDFDHARGGWVTMVFGPMMVQLVAYFGLARLAFGLTWLRSVAIAGLRIALGTILFWALLLATLATDSRTMVFTVLAISSLIAWAVVALLDPRRSIRRWITWMLIGTALSLAVNEAFWRFGFGQSLTNVDTHGDST